MATKLLDKAGEALYQGGDVQCTKCQAVFAPVVYETAEAKGICVEFVCPECKYKYVVAHIDRRGLEIRAQLAAIGRQSPKASMSVINERVRTVRRLRQELKRHVKR